MTQNEIIEEVRRLAKRNLEITQEITELYKKLEEDTINKVEPVTVKENLTVQKHEDPKPETFMGVDPAGGC